MLFPIHTASRPIWQLSSYVGNCINVLLFQIQRNLTTICGHSLWPTEIWTLNVSSGSEANNIGRMNLPVLSVDIRKEEDSLQNDEFFSNKFNTIFTPLSPLQIKTMANPLSEIVFCLERKENIRNISHNYKILFDVQVTARRDKFL